MRFLAFDPESMGPRARYHVRDTINGMVVRGALATQRRPEVRAQRMGELAELMKAGKKQRLH